MIYENSDRKKVLYISYGLGVYGANTSLLNMIKILKDKYDIEPFVLVRAEGPFTKRLDELDIKYICTRFHSWCFQEKSGKNISIKIAAKKIKTILNNIYFNMMAYREIKRLKLDFSIIHSNTSIMNFGCYLSKRTGVPHVMHIREFLEEDYDMRFAYGKRFFSKYISDNSEAIITNSESVKNKYSKLIDKKNISVIYNGVDLKENEFYRDFSELKTKKIINFVFIGLVSQGKNQLEALIAVNKLKKFLDNKNCFKLYIVGGGDKNYHDSLVLYAENNGLNKYVEFVGYLDCVAEFRKKMDIGIICSKKEAFGRVIVEDMLSQMPVIGANSGGVPELIDHGKTGILYEPGSADQLAEAMKKLIENRDLIEAMGKNGHQKAKKYFTAEMNAMNVNNVYGSVLNTDKKIWR